MLCIARVVGNETGTRIFCFFQTTVSNELNNQSIKGKPTQGFFFFEKKEREPLYFLLLSFFFFSPLFHPFYHSWSHHHRVHRLRIVLADAESTVLLQGMCSLRKTSITFDNVLFILSEIFQIKKTKK